MYSVRKECIPVLEGAPGMADSGEGCRFYVGDPPGTGRKAGSGGMDRERDGGRGGARTTRA